MKLLKIVSNYIRKYQEEAGDEVTRLLKQYCEKYNVSKTFCDITKVSETESNTDSSFSTLTYLIKTGNTSLDVASLKKFEESLHDEKVPKLKYIGMVLNSSGGKIDIIILFKRDKK